MTELCVAVPAEIEEVPDVSELDVKLVKLDPIKMQESPVDEKAVSLYVSECVCGNGKVAFKIDLQPMNVVEKPTIEIETVEQLTIALDSAQPHPVLNKVVEQLDHEAPKVEQLDHEAPNLEQLDHEAPNELRDVEHLLKLNSLSDVEHLLELPEQDDGEPEQNCCQIWGDNWRQYTSVIPGMLLLLAVGMHNCYSFAQIDLRYTSSPIIQSSGLMHSLEASDMNSTDYEYMHFRSVTGYLRNYTSLVLILVWYGGAIIGSMLGAILVQGIKKRTIYYIGALLQVISGSLFYLVRINPFLLQLEGRILSGVVYGLIHLTVTVHASDIASEKMRRVISKSITILMALSSLAYAFTFTELLRGRNSIALNGFELMLWGGLTLIVTPFLTNETVPFLLMHKKESKALKKLTKLNSERRVSSRTVRQFEQLKSMVKEDQCISKNILTGGNLRPLFMVINARLLSLLTSSIPLTFILIQLGVFVLQQSNQRLWFSEIHLLRIVGGILALTIASWAGRHKLFYSLSTLFTCAFIFVASGTLFFPFHRSLERFDTILIYVGFAVYGLISLGIDAYQHIHTIEAFSFTKKPWSISTVAIIEHIAHALLIAGYCMRMYTVLAIGTTVLAFIVPIILLVMVPDTHGLSLLQIRNKFNKYLVKKFANISTEV